MSFSVIPDQITKLMNTIDRYDFDVFQLSKETSGNYNSM